MTVTPTRPSYNYATYDSARVDDGKPAPCVSFPINDRGIDGQHPLSTPPLDELPIEEFFYEDRDFEDVMSRSASLPLDLPEDFLDIQSGGWC